MYVIKRQSEEDFVQQINPFRIETGSILEKSIILDDIDQANKLLEYVKYDEDFIDYTVAKITFEEIVGDESNAKN